MEECPNAYHRWSQELYQQLLAAKVYYNRKTKSQENSTDQKCRLCGDSLENVHFTMTFSNCLRSVRIIPASIQGLREDHKIYVAKTCFFTHEFHIKSGYALKNISHEPGNTIDPA